MKREKRYQDHATRREAAHTDRETLRRTEAEDAKRGGRPSRYRGRQPARDGQPARPAGVWPTAAYGRALIGYEPGEHIATAHAGVRRRRSDRRFMARLPDVELDDEGAEIERPDLPPEVDEDGVVMARRRGVKMDDVDFEPADRERTR